MRNVLKQHYGMCYGRYKLSLQMTRWLLDRGGGRQRSEGGREEGSKWYRGCNEKKGQMEEKTAPRQSRLTDKLSAA